MNCKHLLMSSAIVAVLSCPAVSLAQVAPDEPVADAAEEFDASADSIVVTGSRISGFTAPTPTTVIGIAEQQQIAAPTIADVLNRLPSFNSGGPTAQGVGTANPGANYLDLRGMGANRTLVLLDGRRHVPTSGEGNVDINVFPSALIKRVDVVTGGASAAYGSDAVAGVVNVILDTEFTGIKGSAQSGITQRGDDKTFRTSLAWGTKLAGGDGHFMIAGEFTKTWDTPYYGDRKWAKNYQLLSIPGGGVTGPARTVVPNVTYSNSTYGGLINAGPLRGIQFLPGGIATPFEYGTNVGTTFMQGGGGDTLNQDVLLDVPSKRGNIFARFGYDFSPAFKFSIQASHAQSKTMGSTTPPTDTSITILRDNAFLPQSVRDQMVALNLSNIRVGRLNRDLGLIKNGGRSKVYRIVTAVEGDLGGSWSWDAHVEYGRTKYEQRQPNNRRNALWLEGIDSVVAPAGVAGIMPGSIVCRSTLADPGNGCLPINIFGHGSPDEKALERVKGTAWFRSDLEQVSSAVNVSGEPVALPAGPLSVALGAEYRRISLNTDSDEVSQNSGWRIGNFQPLSGSFNVKEVYGEVRIPILAEVPFARELTLNAAGRYTSYSTSGDVQTWKLGLTYAFDGNVSFRGGISRDIRAPNVAELFQAGNQLASGITDRLNNNLQYIVASFSGGNANLAPEKAITKTIGVVVTPEFVTGLRFSTDYYDIKLRNTITTLGNQGTIDACFLGFAEACAGIVRSPETGLITRIDAQFRNIGGSRQRGLDLEAAYDLAGDSIASWINGRFQFRVLATHLFEATREAGTSTLNDRGEILQPKWRASGRLSYSDGPFGFYIEERYVGPMVYSNTFGPMDIDNNRIGSALYTTASVSYDLIEGATGFLVVDNLFDRDPEIVGIAGFGTQTSARRFDVLGRRVTAGVRFSF